MMKKTIFIIVILILVIIALSGCLETQEIFPKKASNLLNQAECDTICGKLNDLANIHKYECDSLGNCYCKCYIGFY